MAGRAPGPPEAEVTVSSLRFMEGQRPRTAAHWVISSMRHGMQASWHHSALVARMDSGTSPAPPPTELIEHARTRRHDTARPGCHPGGNEVEEGV